MGLIPIAVVVCVFGLLAARFVAVRVRAAQRLVSDRHLREIAATLPALRVAAFADTGVPMHPPTDRRIALTSEGVALFFSEQRFSETDQWLAHISISRRGGFIPWAAAGRFAFIILQHLGVPVQTAAVAHTPAGIVHLVFVHRGSGDAPATGELPEDLMRLRIGAEEFMRTVRQSGTLRRSERELLASVLCAP
ncbi:MAG: hypothetical protein IPJ78_19530 [Gemmatimonadetes bacterium]|nr:hypothetical protein [Gemmatimonadota bacterium]